MNDIRSRNETLPRAAAAAIRRGLEVMPVVVVTGARQTGKSTLARSLPELGGWPYLSLDDLDVRDQARVDPAALLSRSDSLILDEVQRAPDLLIAVKAAVDRDRPRRPGRYLLTGSANLLLMERVSESLAGRAYYVKLWPLTRRERLGLGRAGQWSELLGAPASQWPDLLAAGDELPADWRELARIGGLPVPAHELTTTAARAVWYDGYIETYLERDLQQLSRIDDLGDFRRLMRAAAQRSGSVLNQADLARDVALSRPTAHRWLNLLETSYQLVTLHAYAVNRTKRLVKSPKLYWTDVGLGLHLSGAELSGTHLENLILCDLVAWRELHLPRPEVLYWRTHNQEEVDFVIEAGQKLIAIEVKATARPSYADARHLLTFIDEYGDAVHGALLLHTGDETFWLSQRVLATPWWRVV